MCISVCKYGKVLLNMNKHLGKRQPACCRIKSICQTNADVYKQPHKKNLNILHGTICGGEHYNNHFNHASFI